MSDNNSSSFACRLHSSHPSAICGEGVTWSPAEGSCLPGGPQHVCKRAARHGHANLGQEMRQPNGGRKEEREWSLESGQGTFLP